MLGIKLRVGLLGLLAVLLLGSYAAAPAFAVGGPFCHHRPLRGSGNGALIPEAEPERIAGGGGVQHLVGEVLLMRVDIESEQAQTKGITYDNPDQCQSKVEITYIRPRIRLFPNCVVTVNSNNVAKLYGHQAWKWNGTTAQLGETNQKAAGQHRDWIFLPTELPQGATGLPEGTFAGITLEDRSSTERCAVRTLQGPVIDSAAAAGFSNPQNRGEKQELEEWGTQEEVVSTGGEGRQHFWNGREFIGVTTGLFFARRPAKYEGKLTVNTIGRQEGIAPQEIAYFEE